ncbi:MAG: PqiC family protein [Gammaproteobacteria bacterium]
MNRRASGARWVLAAVALWLGGCSTPGGGTPPPQYFLLEAPAPLTPLAESAPLELAVGPVTVAEYLDQPRLVIRAAAGEVELLGRARWAMPLGANVADVLRAALEQLLPGTRTVAFPSAQPAPFAYRVAVEVRRLDGRPGGQAALVASWRVLGADGATLAWPEARTELVEPVTGDDPGALVAAEAILVGQLARRIAETLVELPR